MSSSPDHWNGFEDDDQNVGGSDSNTVDNDDSDDDPSGDSDDSSAGVPNVFVDDEASEADSDADSYGQQSEGSNDDEDALPLFPKFMELPPEIRELVWKAFCPDLTGRPRVFEILVRCSSWDDACLSLIHPCQLDELRLVSAVHRESREIALKASPSHMQFPGEYSIIPCNFDKDVVLLSFSSEVDVTDEALELIDDHLGPFRNVALHVDTIMNFFMPSFLQFFSDLDNVFVVDEATSQCGKGLAWCVSGNSHEYKCTIEYDSLDDTPVEATYIWPDVENHCDAAHREFPNNGPYLRQIDLDGELVEEDEDIVFETSQDDKRERIAFDYMTRQWVLSIIRYRGIIRHQFRGNRGASKADPEKCPGVWPMTRFIFGDGHDRLEELRGRPEPWTEWNQTPEPSEFTSSENEYESDGIDDDEVEDHLSSDEEDDLLAHLLDQDGNGLEYGDVYDANDSESDDSIIDGPQSITLDVSDLNGLEAAQFSSASEDGSDGEASAGPINSRHRPHVIVDDSDDDDNEAQGESSGKATAGPGNSRHRPHVILDDSEDEDDEAQGPMEPARGVKRRARVLSDTDDDDVVEAPSSRAAKRRARPAMASDSEDDEEEEEGQKGATVKDDAHSEDDEGEEDEEEASSDYDEPPPPKKMSLAKRLQMEYPSRRTGHHSRNDTDDEDEDEGGNSYRSASDDDEGDDDGFDGGGLVDMGRIEPDDEEDNEYC